MSVWSEVGALPCPSTMNVESVDVGLLRNCTVLAANRFPWSTTANDTTQIEAMDRRELFGTLKQMIGMLRERYQDEDAIR